MKSDYLGEKVKCTRIIKIKNISIGAGIKPIIAGPCAVEDEEMYLKSVISCKEAGACMLRGNIFKPRTSPYDFQGIGDEGVELLKAAKKITELPIVSEILDIKDLELIYDIVDVIQIGSRNMQNFALLKEMGKIGKPVLLKRGYGAKVNEWLLAAEYIISTGNHDVILCERGISTFEPSVRYSLDISSIPVIKELSTLPVLVDPSHSAGDWKYVKALAKAGLAAGADGLMVEVHVEPEKALCDGKQSLSINNFINMIKELEDLNFRVKPKIYL